MLPHYDKVPGVHKIAVLRANALGDFIFTLPALEALRTTYPNAEIVLLAKEWHASFLARRPSPINRVVVIPTYGGVGAEPGEVEEDPIEQERFFQHMQQERFDLALQLHGGGAHSNPFVLRLGARMTAGTQTPDAPVLDRSIPYIYFQHEVLRYLEVVSLVGATSNCIEPHIEVTKEDFAEVERVVPDQGRPLVALHPGAGDPRRRWPAEKFAAVGDALAAAGAHVLVTGTKSECGTVEAVVGHMQSEGQNLAEQISLGGLAALFKRCRVVVSNDSGPLHLASAVGAATIGIYWCFNMINSSILTRSRHRPFVSWQLLCPVCGSNHTHADCPHEVSFVSEVPGEDVTAATLDLFKEHKASPVQ
ncbi:LPS biosynthesis-related glycosyltransferase [Reticulibacter mediterranei]|uniref:LPS biosynthesis-related glycosyltransferase n=1 Tax=Reticulibacter mediterranei TaxID=2778369 RepID=A0A8J3IEY8_9CHLR|nr:glycosyltransferase family 9 protein [Reticulibacter mediterranei]GHO94124.1 LPS biosynthesis-related glycosyltransferase [Reticulibacter mediterranei]